MARHCLQQYYLSLSNEKATTERLYSIDKQTTKSSSLSTLVRLRRLWHDKQRKLSGNYRRINLRYTEFRFGRWQA